MKEVNRELWDSLREHGYTLIEVRHDWGAPDQSYYRIHAPGLQGHFTIVDRYDHFDKYEDGCRYLVYSDYEFAERPAYVTHHSFVKSIEECIQKMDEWAERVKTEEGWIVQEYREPVRYGHPWVGDWVLGEGVEIWAPVKEEAEND